MFELNLILLIPPTIISLIHLLGLNYKRSKSPLDESLHSFSAGISIAYVFLFLLPEVLTSSISISSNLTLILFGLVIFHVPLKFVFTNFNSNKRTDLSNLIHGISISIYGFLVSYLLVDIFRTNITEGIVLLVILIVHNFLSEITDHEKSNNDFAGSLKKILIIASPIIGGIAAILIGTEYVYKDILLAITSGTILYIVFREEIPRKKESKPIFFLIGVIVLLSISIFIK